MQKRLLVAGPLALAMSLLLPIGARAQEQAPKSEPASEKTSTDPSGSNADSVRRDPKGIKGISPFWESIKLGDSAYLARDYANATAQYRDAITKEPRNPLGHLRIAEAQMSQGEWKEAMQSVAAVVRFADKSPSMKARGLMLQALLYERQQQYDRALEAWKKYQQFGREQPRAKVHQRTPPERLKRIGVAKQMAEQYAAVKQRIQERLKDADAAAKKNAK